MKTIGISSVTLVAVALMMCPASAEEGAKGGAAAGGGMAAPAGGAGGEGTGGTRMLPGSAAPGEPARPGEASPGMKPAGRMQAEPGQRQNGENVGESPAKKPMAPGEPAMQRKEMQKQGEEMKKPGSEAQPANKAGMEAQPGKEKAGETNKQNAGEAGKQNAGEAGAGKQGGQARPAPKITNVQETKIQQTIRNINVTPVHVDFNIGVGVAIPRTVVLTPLPPAIITIVPEYEGYRFFVVPGEIIIVDPFTLEIVAVLPL